MTHEYETTVYVPKLDLEFEIVADVTIHVSNSGIGSYEFWGARGFDKGSPQGELESFEILSIHEVETGFEFAESHLIRGAVEENIIGSDAIERFTERETN